MSAKYKVGDIVQIRDDLIADRLYDGCCFVKCMWYYKGKTVKIIETVCGRYRILDYVGESEFYFSDDMIVGKSNARGML